MRGIITAPVFFKQRTVCIINVWGCAEILPLIPVNARFVVKDFVDIKYQDSQNHASLTPRVIGGGGGGGRG